MKTTIITTIATCILGLAGAASATPYVSTFQVRGQGAYGGAYADDGKCIVAGVDISANSEVAHSRGGQPVTEAGGWAGFWTYNWCTGEEGWGYTYIPNANFSINNSNASASFEFNVDFFGWQLTPDGYWDYVYLGSKRVSLSANWTAVGEASRGMETWTGRWGQFFGRSRWMGVSRDAEVSMTATVDGAPLTFGFSYGSFGSYSGGTTEIYRN